MRAILALKKKADKEILEKVTSRAKILYVSSLIDAIGIETDDIEEIKKLDFVKEARISEKADLLLKDAIKDIGALELMRKNLLGYGVTISVIDSGMNTTDPSLGYFIKDEKDFTEEGMFDSVGHGTIVAKIIKTIALESNLLNAKVVDMSGQADEINIMAALEWSFNKKADIINISLGIPRKCKGDCPLCMLTDKIVENGSMVVAAAGNFGMKMNSITCPGNAGKSLTIGSIDKENKIASFSSRGSKENHKPDFVTSGIIQIGRLQISGTSISAPLASGSIALLISKHSMNYENLFKSLKETAEDLQFEHYEQGFGKIKIDKAFEKVGKWSE
ncbi:MAG: S8 family serine peptidase [Candidatus Methanoperedens sp.]|nr:S8 family serine peptidase [Candidatus Methanoperedens sp.]